MVLVWVCDIEICTFELEICLFQCPDTCGAHFISSSATDSGTVCFGTQIVLSPGFAGCGRLMRYNVTAICQGMGMDDCSIVFQLWRPTELGVYTLIHSTMNSYNPPTNGQVQVLLTFPVDVDFTAGDMVGFFHNPSGKHPLEVYKASASDHSYLQWSSVATLRSVLTTEDATTKLSALPILNVEGTVHNYMHIFVCQ